MSKNGAATRKILPSACSAAMAIPYAEGDVRYVPTIDEEVRSLESATLEGARDFYFRFAGGSHAELAIVGDFDAATVRALLDELFGSWTSREPYVRVPEPLVAKRAKEIRAETPDKANAVLSGELALPVTDTSPDYPALAVANFILGGSPNSRLWERIRQREGLSYAVYSALDASSFEPNTSLTLEAIFAPENLVRLKTALNEEIVRAVRDGFTDKEVADAKKAMLAGARAWPGTGCPLSRRAHEAGLPGPNLCICGSDRRWNRRRQHQGGQRRPAQVRPAGWVRRRVRRRFCEKALVRWSFCVRPIGKPPSRQAVASLMIGRCPEQP